MQDIRFFDTHQLSTTSQMMMSGAILNRELLSLYLYLYLSLSLSLRFNGHFTGESGLAGVYWRKGWWRWWWQLDYWRYMSCKAPVESSPSTNQHPAFLQAGCPSCRPTKSVKALKGKISHSMDLLTPRPPVGLPTLSLTTNSSWLPWGKVAIPLISPLMPDLGDTNLSPFRNGPHKSLSPLVPQRNSSHQCWYKRQSECVSPIVSDYRSWCIIVIIMPRH